jgi:hypothetical protein
MNMPALAMALLVVTSVTVVSLGLADRAYLSAERDADERRVAIALSERLVAADSQVATRANVLDDDALAELNATRLRDQFPVTGDDVAVRLGERTLAAAGDPTDGTTVRRIVLVENRTAASLTPRLSASDSAVTLPRRSPRVEIELSPPSESKVGVVKANEKVVLRNESGLEGRFEVRLSRFETTTLTFEADGSLPEGSVELTYYPAETSKAVLAVTVDG